jgi:hypothetical protein
MIKLKLYQINPSLKGGLTILHSTLEEKQLVLEAEVWLSNTDPEIDMIV